MGLTTTLDKAHVEPISPELVLIDPELRSRARTDHRPDGRSSHVEGNGFSRLATDTRRHAAAPFEVGATGAAAGRMSLSADAEIYDLDGSNHRSWGRRIGFVGLAALLCAGGVALALRFASDRVHTARQQHVVFDTNVSAKPGPKTSDRTAANGSNTSQRRIDATKVHTGQTTRSLSPSGAHQPQTAPSSSSATGAKRSVIAPSTRLFVWPAVKHASYYKVQFSRGGHVVFEASPSVPRLELPTRWAYKGRDMRLVPAVYSWVVLPAFGTRSHPRYGDAIVRSTWVARA